ncbi:hypothetical protein ACL0VS_03650 [Chryseobacterium sp. PMSZPI]|uniref:hypothetical protein n=1 Tax=Chryseobacterium sp. PMSZPI TaxID=1033900 RepID=UPI0039A3098B
MKNLIILLLVVLGCSGSNEKKIKAQNENNIVIKSSEFKGVIKNFYKDALYYSPYTKNDTVSVSIWKNKNDINVSLNSFVKLKSEYYIGKTDLDSLKILFYTNNLESTKDFIELKFVTKDIIHKKVYNKETGPPVYKETYEKFYTYKDGKLTTMKLN